MVGALGGRMCCPSAVFRGSCSLYLLQQHSGHSLCTAAPLTRGTSLAGHRSSLWQCVQLAHTNQPCGRDKCAGLRTRCNCGGPVVWLGIDPDASGAVGCLILPEAGASMVSATVEVFDMPTEQIEVVARKRKRRRLDAQGVTDLVRELTHRHATIRAVLESPAVSPLNGKFSWLQAGYAFGIWHGVLSSAGILVEDVSARRWKMDMDLNKRDKRASRQLAARLFPSLADSL
eukprot:evm.model.scf_3074.1 EVM.evm.TU.scf_3074.1   scf_3074:5727-9120(-)